MNKHIEDKIDEYIALVKPVKGDVEDIVNNDLSEIAGFSMSAGFSQTTTYLLPTSEKILEFWRSALTSIYQRGREDERKELKKDLEQFREAHGFEITKVLLEEFNKKLESPINTL